MNSKCLKYLQLTVLVGLLLWFVINIPFFLKPAYEDLIKTNPAIADFLNFNFLLNFLLVLFLSTIVINFKKQFIFRYRVLIIVLSGFFYSTFRILKSFDVTDNGFHLSKSWGILHGSLQENLDFWAGSSFVNGLWLSIAGEPNLIWARLGYVLVVVGVIFFSYKIYETVFKEFHHFLIFFPLIFFYINFNYYLTANYDNMPLLATLIGVWFILKEKNIKPVNFVLSGIFFGTAICLKFNYILILTLPVIISMYFHHIKDDKYIKKALLIFLGYLIPLIMNFFLLMFSGSLDYYVGYLKNELFDKNIVSAEEEVLKTEILNFSNENRDNKNNSADPYFFLTDSLKNDSLRQHPMYKREFDQHDLKSIFEGYFKDLRAVINDSLGALYTILLIIIVFSNKIESKYLKIFFSSLVIFYFFYTAYKGFSGTDYVYISSLLFCGYLFYIFNEVKDKQKYLLPFLLTFMVAFYSFPGSNISLNVVYRSGAGLLLSALPIAFLYNCKTSILKIKLNFKYYSLIMIGFFVFSTIKSWGYNNVHRDAQNRSFLNTMFKSKQLFGIHTTAQRAQVVDELLTYFSLEDYTRNDTPALFMDWLPMFYYLTETNCILHNPWMDSFKSFRTEFDKASKLKCPIYIIFSSKFTRNNDWPLNDNNFKKYDTLWINGLKQDDYIRYWMKDKQYIKSFENKMFEVWKLNSKE